MRPLERAASAASGFRAPSIRAAAARLATPYGGWWRAAGSQVSRAFGNTHPRYPGWK